MKGLLILSVFIVVLSAAACKGRDKCGTCPTFSGVEQVEKDKA